MRTTSRVFAAPCLLQAVQAPALADTVAVMISGGFGVAYDAIQASGLRPAQEKN